MTVKSRNLGCLGWTFVWIGVLLLLGENWGLAWAGLAIAIGATYLFRGFREKGQEEALFPAAILIITGSAILVQIQGWYSFDVWRIWPIFFGSVGLGLTLIWGQKGGGWGTLAAGGLLLFASGYGLASPSWYRYLRDLRKFIDLWPALLLVLGVILIVSYWRKRSSESSRSTRGRSDDSPETEHKLL